MIKNMWNPWHGCHKCSPGCLNCYVFFLDKQRDKNSSIVTRSKSGFSLPLKKDRNGKFKIEDVLPQIFFLKRLTRGVMKRGK